MVGGPDQNDKFFDDRQNYHQSEVALDYNAGLQAAIAGIISAMDNDLEQVLLDRIEAKKEAESSDNQTLTLSDCQKLISEVFSEEDLEFIDLKTIPACADEFKDREVVGFSEDGKEIYGEIQQTKVGTTSAPTQQTFREIIFDEILSTKILKMTSTLAPAGTYSKIPAPATSVPVTTTARPSLDQILAKKMATTQDMTKLRDEILANLTQQENLRKQQKFEETLQEKSAQGVLLINEFDTDQKVLMVNNQVVDTMDMDQEFEDPCLDENLKKIFTKCSLPNLEFIDLWSSSDCRFDIFSTCVNSLLKSCPDRWDYFATWNSVSSSHKILVFEKHEFICAEVNEAVVQTKIKSEGKTVENLCSQEEAFYFLENCLRKILELSFFTPDDDSLGAL